MTDPECNSFHTLPNQEELDLESWQKEGNGDIHIHIPTAPLLTVAKIWQQPKCPPIDKQIKKKWCVYTTDYDLDIKRNKTCHQHRCGWT